MASGAPRAAVQRKRLSFEPINASLGGRHLAGSLASRVGAPMDATPRLGPRYQSRAQHAGSGISNNPRHPV